MQVKYDRGEDAHWDGLKSSVVIWQGLPLFDPESSSRLASAKFDPKTVSVKKQIADVLEKIGICEEFEAGVTQKQEICLCYRGFVVTHAKPSTYFQMKGNNGEVFDLRMESSSLPLGSQSRLIMRAIRVFDTQSGKFMLRMHECHLKGINTHCYALVFSDVQDEKLGEAMTGCTAEADANNCHRYLANANAYNVSLGLLCDERQAPVVAFGISGTPFYPVDTSNESGLSRVAPLTNEESSSIGGIPANTCAHTTINTAIITAGMQGLDMSKRSKKAEDDLGIWTKLFVQDDGSNSGAPSFSDSSYNNDSSSSYSNDSDDRDDSSFATAEVLIATEGKIGIGRNMSPRGSYNDRKQAEREAEAMSIVESANESNPIGAINHMLQKVFRTNKKKALNVSSISHLPERGDRSAPSFKYVLNLGDGCVTGDWMGSRQLAERDVFAKLLSRLRVAGRTRNGITSLVESLQSVKSV